MGKRIDFDWSDIPDANVFAGDLLYDAAPDLLEALEWLVHLHHGVSRDGSKEIADAEWRDAIDSAEAALDSAKGEGDDAKDRG